MLLLLARRLKEPIGDSTTPRSFTCINIAAAAANSTIATPTIILVHLLVLLQQQLLLLLLPLVIFYSYHYPTQPLQNRQAGGKTESSQ